MSLFFSFLVFFSCFFFSFFLLFLSCSEESADSSLEESAAGRKGNRGEPRGVGVGLEDAEELEVEVEVELGDTEEAEEQGHRLPIAALVDIGDTIHNSFIKAGHNSSVHKYVHNSFMTVVSVL